MATKITTRVLADDAVTDAKIADVTLTTATQSASDNTTKIATTAYVTTAIANLADSAPSTLNTLNELAAALGDDANYATTTTNAIAGKLPLAGGALTGNIGVKVPSLLSFRANSNEGAIQYGKRGVLFSDTGVTTDIANNTYVTSSNQRAAIEADIASYYQQYQGVHKWFNAPSVSAGATQTFVERMRIDSSGKIEIGNNIPMWSGEYGGALFLKGNNSTADRFAEITTVDSNGATTGTGLVVKGAGVSMKVGIGTNSPIRLLDLKDQGTGDPGIRLESQSYSMDVITLRNGDGRVGFGGDAITVLQSGNVGIGEASPLASLHIKQGDSGLSSLNAAAHHIFLEDTGSNGPGMTMASGTSSNCTLAFGDSDSNYRGFMLYDNSADSLKFGTAGTERMRIHANGKVGFSANGMGDVSTIPRDFAFFTEGSTNGVEIRSNDQRLIMLGAGGSGGAASDDGYLTMSSQGVAKLWLSSNGSSVFNGGAVGINRTPSVNNSKLEVGGADNVPLIIAEASGFYGGIGANGSTGKGRGLQMFAGANIVATFNNQTNVAYTSDGLFAANARPQRINCTGSGQMLFGYTDSGSGLYSAAMGMEFDEHNGQNPPISQWVDGWVMKALVSGTKTLRIETDGDIYNVNGTFSSGSDRRIKKEISDASSQWNDVKAVRVRKFKLGATEAGSPHDHFHIGVIAQEIEEAGMNGLVKETTPDDGHIKFNPSLAGDKIKTVKYSILQMKAFKALQEAMEKIETLEAKVAALEAE